MVESGSVCESESESTSESESGSESGSGSESVTELASGPESESRSKSSSESATSSRTETFMGTGLVGSRIPAALSASICGSVRRSKPQMWERTAARRGEMRFWARSA